MAPSSPVFGEFRTVLQSRCRHLPLAQETLKEMQALCGTEEQEETSGSTSTHKPKRNRFVCPVKECQRPYRHKGDLKVHVIQKHSIELGDTICPPRSSKEGKDYPCDVPGCNCGYVQERDLRRHIKLKHPKTL